MAPRYEWMNARAGSFSGGPDFGFPTWWNEFADAEPLITSGSPVGAGDILHRTEFAFSATMQWSGTELALPLNMVELDMAGDVGAPGGPTPNPLGTGPGRFAITAQPETIDYIDRDLLDSPKGNDPLFRRTWTTRGYIVSKAIRSPAQYGSGVAPLYTIGVCVRNAIPLGTTTTVGFSFTWNAYLRTLWSVA